MSLNDRDTHSGTGVSFSPIPDRRFHLALIVGPRRLSQSGDRDEVPAISDPCILLGDCDNTWRQIQRRGMCAGGELLPVQKGQIKPQKLMKATTMSQRSCALEEQA
jgi:hypothetical protein